MISQSELQTRRMIRAEARRFRRTSRRAVWYDWLLNRWVAAILKEAYTPYLASLFPTNVPLLAKFADPRYSGRQLYFDVIHV